MQHLAQRQVGQLFQGSGLNFGDFDLTIANVEISQHLKIFSCQKNAPNDGFSGDNLVKTI